MIKGGHCYYHYGVCRNTHLLLANSLVLYLQVTWKESKTEKNHEKKTKNEPNNIH